MDNEKIGLFIASLRKEKNLTQKELGDKIGVTDRAVSRWERGKGCPDISLLDDLSKILDISILELLKGRKLDNNERLENKDLIESMSFTENNTKNKIEKISSYIAITIFTIIIILLLAFFNIKSFYYMNKTYKKGDLTIDEKIFNNIDKRVNLILNNKGIYTDEEYENIKNYVSAIKDLSDHNEAKKFINKEKNTYKELIKYNDGISLYEITGYDFSLDSIVYRIIVKHNIDKLDNMIKFNKIITMALNTKGEIDLSLLYNNDEINQYTVNSLYYITELLYNSYNLILDDIIEVGEIHE